jgi:Domain of unknown function (DUF4166)
VEGNVVLDGHHAIAPTEPGLTRCHAHARDPVDRVLAALLDDPCDRGRSQPPPCDAHYRNLLGAAAWARLPRDIRRRFSTPIEAGQVRLYQGTVVSTSLSGLGRWLASASRLIGGPVPRAHGAGGVAVVVVTRADEHGAQVWTRYYASAGASAQVIQSVKRFAGPTGLEEDLGFGFTMPLTLSVEDGALVFRSSGYAVRLGPWRIPVPRLLEPGVCEIVHCADGPARFTFTLTLTHPRFGRLVQQTATFVDTHARTDP